MAERDGFLRKAREEGLLRILRPLAYRENGQIEFNNKRYWDFSSNDYLGLSNHPKLKEESKKAIDKFGTATSASRLLSGDFEITHLLEKRVAQFKQKEAALVFNSGYQANVGIISALFNRDDCVFADRLVHASIIDGIILSQAKLFRFRHNDTNHLENFLQKERSRFKRALIVTESIFSMDGDAAPLKALANLKQKYDCEFFVDEAHATGIFGKNGSGLIEQENLAKEVDFIMGTFSKALGGFGAYLAATNENIEYLVNTCRSFIFSTALPVHVIACNLASIELVKKEPERRDKLLELARYFRKELKLRGFEIRGESQIIPLILGDNMRAIKFAQILKEQGFWVIPVRPPTVPQGEARLRFSLTYYHDMAVLKRLADEITQIGI